MKPNRHTWRCLLCHRTGSAPDAVMAVARFEHHYMTKHLDKT